MSIISSLKTVSLSLKNTSKVNMSEMKKYGEWGVLTASIAGIVNVGAWGIHRYNEIKNNEAKDPDYKDLKSCYFY